MEQSEQVSTGQAQTTEMGESRVPVRNRREHMRYSVEGWAEVVTTDGAMFLRGKIRDLSAMGCFIETRGEFDLPMGGIVEMRFRLNGAEFRPLAATRMVKPGVGAGFVFLTMNEIYQKKLELLIGWLREQAAGQVGMQANATEAGTAELRSVE